MCIMWHHGISAIAPLRCTRGAGGRATRRLPARVPCLALPCPGPPPPPPCSFLVGIKALDSHPLKPGKRDAGQRDVPVVVGGVSISPGDYLYADEGELICVCVCALL